MTERALINADLKFVKDVLSLGGADLKKCFQCSTCTVACPLTADGVPFPRKEMLYAQWGIKDKLVNSVDSWLCHHCNDCSDQCPRGANPGDVMGAIRAMTIRAHSKPSFFAWASQSLSGVWILFLIPLLIIGGLIRFLHGGQGFAFVEQKPIVYSNMLTVAQIDMIFLPAVGFALVTMLMGVFGFIGGLKQHQPKLEGGESLSQAVIGTIKDVFSHVRFKECGVNQSRSLSHLLMMYGFIGLFITTNLVLLIHYLHEFGVDIQDTPLPFFHPVKLLGNISAVAAFLGIFLIAVKRVAGGKFGRSSSFDWIFIGDMVLTVVSGILAQVFRVADLAGIAFFTYYLHLVFVFFLLAYAPFTKFGHLFYRSVAMVWARYTGRTQAVSEIRRERLPGNKDETLEKKPNELT